MGVDKMLLARAMIYSILKRMDILKQYNQQFPEANKPAPQWQPSNEYGFLINLVMRLSGGKIQNKTQASYVLITVAALMLVVSLFIIFGGGSQAPFKIPLGNRVINQPSEPPHLEKPILR